MGSILGGNSGFSFGSDSQCCDAVVDPISLLTAIGSIAAVSWFLRQAVIDNKVKGGRSFRKERSSLLPDFDDMRYIADHFTDIMHNGNLSFNLN